MQWVGFFINRNPSKFLPTLYRSDVFGSDICTCRPYLIFGVEEAVKEAQRGGSGVVIYFRKEGRALGEVTKYCELALPLKSYGIGARPRSLAGNP